MICQGKEEKKIKKDKKRMRLRGIEPLIYTEKNKKNAISPTTVS